MSGIINVVSEWGAIFVICYEGMGCSIYKLEEKDTQTKLETLFKKGLYSVAVDIAKTHNYDRAAVVSILTRYADHLYSKGDFTGAIEQYCKTIGTLEPSYVIRKFLDAQRIHNLTTYLQKLHECGKATADHTTLLLNCYTKLKDVVSLEKFLKVLQSYIFLFLFFSFNFSFFHYLFPHSPFFLFLTSFSPHMHEICDLISYL